MMKILKQAQMWQQQVRDLPVTEALMLLTLLFVLLLTAQEEASKDFQCFIGQHLQVFIIPCPQSPSYVTLLAQSREELPAAEEADVCGYWSSVAEDLGQSSQRQ